MLRKLIAVAITSGLAKKAWDHYHDGRRKLPVDVTDVIARPAAVADPSRPRPNARLGARRRREGPSS